MSDAGFEAAAIRPWPQGIDAITLIVEVLDGARRFYREVFELPGVFEGATSVVFDFGGAIINLLHVDSATELIGPAATARCTS